MHVGARSHVRLHNYGGAWGLGGTVGAAGSVVVNDFTTSTQASVKGGAVDTGNVGNVSTRGWDEGAGDFQDVTRAGLVVGASSEVEIAEQIAVAGGGGLAGGFGLNLSFNVIGNDALGVGTQAYVQGANINQSDGSGALYVQALHRTYSKSYGGALGVGFSTA